ncbi:MAG: 16S rRNA (cytidine(1402)-2'-O)-methyltransferase [Muribaculaceae bacterium]|nr:16S rRNA (cytidine(1402)-2'-O)-methyltransferase [Muribaculaceae bacterium]
MKEYDFYVVPTPIGNLGDITLRAIEVLKTVDLIACEDSRVTQKLLNHFDIRTRCVSYHKYNERERIAQILEVLKSGKKMALVSDAGTPLICDPGSVIVKELSQNGFSLTALPGANAVITFLSQVSRSDEKFSFIGFLPKSQSQIQEIAQKYKYENVVFYESPNRIIQTLEIIKTVRPLSKVAFGRELTKVFEEVVVDEIDNVISHLKNNVSKGEFVCMIFADENTLNEAEITDKIKLLQDKGFGAKDISVILSELYGFNKNKIYKLSVSKQM